MTKLYIAYGSNMNRAQMRHRCPAARAVKTIMVDDARLVFRGVADIEYHAGSSVPVVLWEITEACERSLDRYEGVASGVYEKKQIPLDDGTEALTYVMRRPGIAPPALRYYETIKAGYADFGIDLGPLEVALKHSFAREQQTPETRRRRAAQIAKGNTQMTRRPMHVPLNAIDEPERWATTTTTNETCKHGWTFGQCDQCDREPLLPLPKSDPRYDGYNWSEKAKAGSKKGKSRSVVYEDRTFETSAHRAAHIQRARPRNKVKPVRQSLDQWMKDKGYH